MQDFGGTLTNFNIHSLIGFHKNLLQRRSKRINLFFFINIVCKTANFIQFSDWSQIS